MGFGSVIDTDPNNYHLMLSKVSYTKNSGYINGLYKPVSNTDKYYFKRQVTDEFILNDRIIPWGYGRDLTLDAKYPLLKLYSGNNIIEVGIIKKTGSLAHASSIYVDYNSLTVIDVGAAIYGTSFSEEMRPSANSLAFSNNYQNGVIAPPAYFFLTKNKIRLRSPETGDWTEYIIESDITGEIIGELLYESLHNIECV